MGGDDHEERGKGTTEGGKDVISFLFILNDDGRKQTNFATVGWNDSRFGFWEFGRRERREDGGRKEKTCLGVLDSRIFIIQSVLDDSWYIDEIVPFT